MRPLVGRANGGPGRRSRGHRSNQRPPLEAKPSPGGSLLIELGRASVCINGTDPNSAFCEV